MKKEDKLENIIVSVVIPVYNVEDYLKECVDSVLKQTYPFFEIILVDDGSTDSSGTICDQYLSVDDRIRVIHQVNGGLSAARNTGLYASWGKYIYFLDSDDYIRRDSLEKLVGIAEKDYASIVFFDAEVFFTDCEEDPDVYRYERSHRYDMKQGRLLIQDLIKSHEYRTAVPLMLFNRAYLLEHHLDFKVGIIHEDELFTFLAFYADGMVAHCHEKLYFRRMRQASIMTASSLIRRYASFYDIYFTLEAMYTDKSIEGECAKLYLHRIAKTVYGRYSALADEDKNIYKDKHSVFKKNVLHHKGYGDEQLQVKSATGVRRFVYRAYNKIRRTLRK